MNILLSYFIFVCSHLAICWDAETKLNRIKTIVLWLVFIYIYLVYTFWRAHSKHLLSRICQQGISTTSKEYFHLKCNRQELWGLGNLKTRPFCKLLNVYSYHYCLAGYPVRSFGVPLLIWDNCHVKIKDQIGHISFLQTACNYGNLKINLNHFINLSIPISDGIWFLHGGVFLWAKQHIHSGHIQQLHAKASCHHPTANYCHSLASMYTVYTKSYLPQIV